MPLDPSALLQSRPVQISSPMELAGQGLTLGNLANQLQMGGLQVQEQQGMVNLLRDHPEMLQQLMGPNSGMDISQMSPQDRQSYGLGLMKLAPPMLTMQKTRAEIDKAVAETAQAQANADKARMDPLASQAADFLTHPDDANWNSFFSRAKQTAQALGTRFPQVTLSDPGDPQQRADFARQISTYSTPPKTQQEMTIAGQKMGPEIGLLNAQLGKVGGEARLLDPEFKLKYNALMQGKTETIDGIQYNTHPVLDNSGMITRMERTPIPAGGPVGNAPPGAMPSPRGFDYNAVNADIMRNGYQNTTVNDAALGGGPQPYAPPGMQQPAPAPQGNATAMMPPQAVQPNAQVGKVGPNKQEETNIAETGKAVGKLTASIPGAVESLHTINDLRQKLSAGVFSGGVQGSAFFKDFANVVAAMPFASDELKKTVANTQVFDNRTMQLVVNEMQSMPNMRMAGPMLGAITRTKADTIMTEQGINDTLDALESMNYTQLGIAKAAANAAVAPGSVGLNALVPPLPNGPGGVQSVTQHPSGAFIVHTH